MWNNICRYDVEFSCFSTANCFVNRPGVNCPPSQYGLNATENLTLPFPNDNAIWISASIFYTFEGMCYSVGRSVLLPPSYQDFEVEMSSRRKYSFELIWKRMAFEWAPTSITLECKTNTASGIQTKEDLNGCEAHFSLTGLTTLSGEYFCKMEVNTSRLVRTWNGTITNPGVCEGIQLTEIKENGRTYPKSLIVQWKELEKQTGVINHLKLIVDDDHSSVFTKEFSCGSSGNSYCKDLCVPDDDCTITTEVETLRPEKRYTARLSCKYHGGRYGTAKELVFTTTAAVPIIKDEVLYLEPAPISANPHDQMVVFINRQNIDRDAGAIVKREAFYAVKGSLSQPKRKDTNTRNASDVQAATEKRVEATDVTNFTLISLTPQTEYSVKLRFYTSVGYGESKILDFRTSEDPFDWIICAVVMVSLFALLLAVAFLANSNPKYDMRFVNLDNSVRLSNRYPIPMDNLIHSIERLLSSKELDNQFEELTKDRSMYRECKIAAYPDNQIKNRYTDILPFDFSRVILHEIAGYPLSDYINASYIHGYKTMYKFIASQGPLPHTRKAYWRMIWEKNVKVMIMLTNCTEGRKEKCSLYWPAHSSIGETKYDDNGKIRIEPLEVDVREKEGFIVRKFKVTKVVPFFTSKRSTSKTITQFHYTKWPDYGCPSRPSQLVNFVMKIREATQMDSSHILVHCSAGVGRTGTYILIDSLIDELQDKATKEIDIFAHVQKMRHFRMNMIQTQAQYTFVHRCAVLLYACMDSWTGKFEELEELQSKYSFLLTKRRIYPVVNLNINVDVEDPDIGFTDSDEESKEEETKKATQQHNEEEEKGSPNQVGQGVTKEVEKEKEKEANKNEDDGGSEDRPQDLVTKEAEKEKEKEANKNEDAGGSEDRPEEFKEE